MGIQKCSWMLPLDVSSNKADWHAEDDWGCSCLWNVGHWPSHWFSSITEIVNMLALWIHQWTNTWVKTLELLVLGNVKAGQLTFIFFSSLQNLLVWFNWLYKHGDFHYAQIATSLLPGSRGWALSVRFVLYQIEIIDHLPEFGCECIFGGVTTAKHLPWLWLWCQKHAGSSRGPLPEGSWWLGLSRWGQVRLISCAADLIAGLAS